MSTPFDELLRRVRAKDEDAAAELVRAYEPEVRKAVHQRLKKYQLVRMLDSMDISQSVLKVFFAGAAEGKYQLDEPSDLVKLLVAIASKKLYTAVRKHTAARRDHRRVTADSRAAQEAMDSSVTPSEKASNRELFEETRRRLTPEERQLAEMRYEGRSWSEIAGEMGGTPQGRRKQLERALDRVARELGLKK